MIKYYGQIVFTILLTSTLSAIQSLSLPDKYYLDPKTTRIPSTFVSSPIDSVYMILDGRIMNKLKKNDFETIEEFESRTRMIWNMPIIGTLSIDKQFTFKSESWNFSYNMDKSVVTLSQSIIGVLNDNTFAEKEFKSLSCLSIDANEGEYVGQNAYGATAVVSNLGSKNYDVAFSNYNEYPTRERDGDYDKVDELVIKFRYPLEDAKILKDNLDVLLICRIVEPYVSSFKHYMPASISTPTSLTMVYNYLYTDIDEIWIVNRQTGLVVFKQKARR